MHNTETLFELFTGAASADAGNAPLDAQAIGEMMGLFFGNTDALAGLAQALAVRFALLASRLKDGDTVNADHVLARLHAAVGQAGQILEGALDLTLLSVIPKEQWGAMN